MIVVTLLKTFFFSSNEIEIDFGIFARFFLLRGFTKFFTKASRKSKGSSSFLWLELNSCRVWDLVNRYRYVIISRHIILRCFVTGKQKGWHWTQCGKKNQSVVDPHIIIFWRIPAALLCIAKWQKWCQSHQVFSTLQSIGGGKLRVKKFDPPDYGKQTQQVIISLRMNHSRIIL